MSAPYTGDPTGAEAVRTNPTITEPQDGDAPTAASVNVALQKLADEIAALKQKVAYLSGVANAGSSGNPAVALTGGAGANGANITGGAGTTNGAVVTGGDGGFLALGGTGVAGIGGAGTTGGTGVTGTGGGPNGVGVGGIGNDSGAGVSGQSTSGYGGSFAGNATRTPLHLTPRAAPSTPAEGDIYQDSGDHHLYVYNGTTWKQLDN